MVCGRGVERVVDECALAGSRYAGDAGKQADRNLRIDMLEVVAAGAEDPQLALLVWWRALLGQGDTAPTGQVVASQRRWIGGDLLGRALGDHLAAVLTSAGSHVHDKVG